MKDNSRLRLVVLRVMVVAILITLLGRLAFMQVAEGARYRDAASSNRIREVVTPAARGQVLDDRGVALVGNRTALVVSVTRSIVRSQPKHGAAVLARLSKVIDIPPEQIALLITPCGERLPNGKPAKAPNCWNGSPLQAVPVQSYSADNPAEVRRVLAIQEHAEDFPGIEAKYAAVREYPRRSLASHVLGYLGPLSTEDLAKEKYKGRPSGSLVGRAGVEAVYDDRLRGVDGVQRLLVDKDATVTGTMGTVAPKAGDNVVLGIDVAIQKAAEKALADGIKAARQRYDRLRGKKFTASRGAVIVVEVNTGRIVTMASYPTYDPTLFVPRISTKEYRALTDDPGEPLISNATQGLYAPGSTFKVVSTAAAVAAGNSINGYYKCPPALRVGNRLFRNFEGEQFGTINFTTTLVKSCDTVYYKLAYDQWVRDGGTRNLTRALEVFPKMARSWGFGSVTGIDLPDERKGLITDRGYKQRFYDQNKAIKCKRARVGYPEVEKTDPARAAYLLALAKEFCSDGWRYNAGDAALFAIGQGDVLVSPLQLVMAYAALANGGTLYEPRLVKGFLAADGSTSSVVAPVRKARLPVTAGVLAYIRDALAKVTQDGGTAQTAFRGWPHDQVSMGGKTGTADVQGKAPTSWFVSFAPADKPRYAMVVMVPEAGTGGTTAAPISRQVWNAMYGFGGNKKLLSADGSLPGALPVVRLDGTIAPPGTVVPRRAAASATPTALSLPVPGGLWAEAPRRRSL